MKHFLIFLIFCPLLIVSIWAFDKIFVLISPPEVADFSRNPDLDSSLIINFNKPVKRKEIKASIFPEVHGEWSFENPLIEDPKEPLLKSHLFRTLVFVPALDLEPDTQYQVRLENIKGFGLEKASSFQFVFKTNLAGQASEDKKNQEKKDEVSLESKVTILPISLDWQDDSLSCEAASLKMALAGKGVFISETEIMEKIGYDLTPYQGGVWGDPYQKYVGDINGKICKTGYGVYWGPVAKAALTWREAQSFSGWQIEKVAKEIKAGNPIVVWGTLSTGDLNDCSWYTPEGKYVLAFKETHVRLLIGFIGSLDNPSKIILNDPLKGRLYWSTDYFLENWKVFNYSGVVIR